MKSDYPNPTVLILNDSSQNAQSIRELLVKEKYCVFFANSMEEALHEIQHHSFDLILIDGERLCDTKNEVCRQIRNVSQKMGSHIPIIYLQPVYENHSNVPEKTVHVDECFLYPRKNPIPISQQNGVDHWDTFVHLSDDHLLSLLRSLIRIRSLESSYEENQRRLLRAQRIMDRELGEAAKMQRSFLPRIFPDHQELELAAIYQPSIKVGGDYYDVFPVDKDHWGLVIADIAGHGSAAAVVMALTQVVVREFGRGIIRPQEALLLFNEKLNANLSSDHYVTMFYAVLDLQSMEFMYSNAGHVPLLIYRSAEKEIQDIKTEPSFPLRTFEMESYEERSISLNPGDRVLFFTDGVLDVQNTQNNFFGQERLEEVFLRGQNYSIKKQIQSIFDATESFRGQRERLDDFTLMVLGRKITP